MGKKLCDYSEQDKLNKIIRDIEHMTDYLDHVMCQYWCEGCESPASIDRIYTMLLAETERINKMLGKDEKTMLTEEQRNYANYKIERGNFL